MDVLVDGRVQEKKAEMQDISSSFSECIGARIENIEFEFRDFLNEEKVCTLATMQIHLDNSKVIQFTDTAVKYNIDNKVASFEIKYLEDDVICKRCEYGLGVDIICCYLLCCWLQNVLF